MPYGASPIARQLERRRLNRFLATLPPHDFSLLAPHLRPIALERGVMLHDVGEEVAHVYFPHSGTAAARVRHRNTAVYNSAVALATKSPIRITSPKIVTWEIEMARGTVKWFNPTKGYGFIQPQAGGKDVFVHISAVERAGLSTLNEGQHLEYEIEENRGKTSAVNLRVK